MDKQALKRAAALQALEFVQPNMRLGIGTGSTAEEFIHLLADKVRKGLNITGVPTSERSRILCAELGIALTDLNSVSHLDMTVDGADELDSQLRLIKGGGGALLREKITAYASAKMLVIADYSKLVTKLGAFPLPIEVNIFGLAATKQAIKQKTAALGLKCLLQLRLTEEKTEPFITDGGHYILDAHFGAINVPEKLAAALCEVPGVVEHGLFFHPNCCVLLAQENGTIRQMDKK